MVLVYVNAFIFVCYWHWYGRDTRYTNSVAGTRLTNITIVTLSLGYFWLHILPHLMEHAPGYRAKAIEILSVVPRTTAHWTARFSASPWSPIYIGILFALLLVLVLTLLLRFRGARVLKYWRAGSTTTHEPPPSGVPASAQPPVSAQAQCAAEETPSEAARGSSAKVWTRPQDFLDSPPRSRKFRLDESKKAPILRDNLALRLHFLKPVPFVPQDFSKRVNVPAQSASAVGVDHKARRIEDKSPRVMAPSRKLKPARGHSAAWRREQQAEAVRQAGQGLLEQHVVTQRQAPEQESVAPFVEKVQRAGYEYAAPSLLVETEHIAAPVRDAQQSAVEGPVAVVEELAGDLDAANVACDPLGLLEEDFFAHAAQHDENVPWEYLISIFAALKVSSPTELCRKPFVAPEQPAIEQEKKKAKKTVRFNTEVMYAPPPKAFKARKPRVEATNRLVLLGTVPEAEEGETLRFVPESTVAEKPAGYDEGVIATHKTSAVATPLEKEMEVSAPQDGASQVDSEPVFQAGLSSTELPENEPVDSELAPISEEPTIEEHADQADAAPGVPIASPDEQASPGCSHFEPPQLPFQSPAQEDTFTAAPLTTVATIPAAAVAVSIKKRHMLKYRLRKAPKIDRPHGKWLKIQTRVLRKRHVSLLAETDDEEVAMGILPTGRALVVVHPTNFELEELTQAALTLDMPDSPPTIEWPQSQQLNFLPTAPLLEEGYNYEKEERSRQAALHTSMRVDPKFTYGTVHGPGMGKRKREASDEGPGMRELACAPGCTYESEQRSRRVALQSSMRADPKFKYGTVHGPCMGKRKREISDEGPDMRELVYAFKQRHLALFAPKPVVTFAGMSRIDASATMVNALESSERELEQVLNLSNPQTDKKWEPLLTARLKGIQKYAGYSDILQQAKGWKWTESQIEENAADRISVLADSLLDKMDSYGIITNLKGKYDLFPTPMAQCNILKNAYVRPAVVVAPSLPPPPPPPPPPTLAAGFPTPQWQPMMALSQQTSDQIAAGFNIDFQTMKQLKPILSSTASPLDKAAAMIWWFEWHLDNLYRKGTDNIIVNLAGKFAGPTLLTVMKWAIVDGRWDENKTGLCIGRRLLYITEAIIALPNVARNGQIMKLLGSMTEKLRAAVG